MAENWIAIDHTTPRKPEIVSLAMTLGISKREATGLMVDVWIWADQNTYDGGTNCNGVSVTCALLDITFEVTGLADALFSVGWLEIAEDCSITFPNFGDNNGKTAKTRKQANRRVARHRVTQVKRDGNGPSVTKSLPQEQEQEQEHKTHGHGDLNSAEQESVWRDLHDEDVRALAKSPNIAMMNELHRVGVDQWGWPDDKAFKHNFVAAIIHAGTTRKLKSPVACLKAIMKNRNWTKITQKSDNTAREWLKGDKKETPLVVSNPFQAAEAGTTKDEQLAKLARLTR